MRFDFFNRLINTKLIFDKSYQYIVNHGNNFFEISRKKIPKPLTLKQKIVKFFDLNMEICKIYELVTNNENEGIKLLHEIINYSRMNKDYSYLQTNYVGNGGVRIIVPPPETVWK